MSDSVTATVHILDKEYRVSCKPDEQAELEETARLLDREMTGIRNSGKVIGLDRIAVMAALNIAHELLDSRKTATHASEASGQRVQSLIERVDRAIESHRQLEL